MDAFDINQVPGEGHPFTPHPKATIDYAYRLVREYDAWNKEQDAFFLKHLREGRCWSMLKQRCFNKNNPRWVHYGGKGITMCERWAMSFENFMEDMGPAPGIEYTIDRIDHAGSYEPGNCRWAIPAK